MFVALIAHHKNYEKLHKNVNENMFSLIFLCNFSCICNFGIFVWIFMRFSPECRTKKLGMIIMIYTILGSFCSFLNGKGPILGPKSGLGKFLTASHHGLHSLLE